MDKLDHAIHELTAVVNGIGSYRFTHTAEDLLEWLEELKKRREKQTVVSNSDSENAKYSSQDCPWK